MKNSSDTVGNRTRNLPACRAVPQPAAPPQTAGGWTFKFCKTRTLQELKCKAFCGKKNEDCAASFKNALSVLIA